MRSKVENPAGLLFVRDHRLIKNETSILSKDEEFDIISKCEGSSKNRTSYGPIEGNQFLLPTNETKIHARY